MPPVPVSLRVAAERDPKIINAWAKGASHKEIATEYGIHPNSVARIIVRHRRRSVAAIQATMEEKTAEVVSRRIRLIEQAERGYELSMQKRDKFKEKAGSRDGKPFDELGFDTEETPEGDPRFLTIISNQLDAIERILGLAKPAKIAHTDSAGNDVPFQIIEIGIMPSRQSGEVVIDSDGSAIEGEE